MLGLVGERLRKFAADRRADDVSFGLLVRIALTPLILIPIWWVVRAAIDMATMNPNIADIFLGAAGIALIFLLPPAQPRSRASAASTSTRWPV